MLNTSPPFFVNPATAQNQAKHFCTMYHLELYFQKETKIRTNMKRTNIVKRISYAIKQVSPTAKAVLYGSEARQDSDIDLLVLIDGDSLSIKEEERIIAPLYDIEIETGVAINARVMLKKFWENLPFKTPFQRQSRS